MDGLRPQLDRLFVREVNGIAVGRWYEGLADKGLSAGTAVRHSNVMHHMMETACTLWSKETGLERNPADQVEVECPDDTRGRYLSEDELGRLKRALEEKKYRKGTNDLNRTAQRLRVIVLIAVTTGMRSSEKIGLWWTDVMYGEGLLAVRAKLKDGKMRYVPMPSQLAWELREFSAIANHSNAAHDDDRILPPKKDAVSGRQRLEGSFDDLLEREN